MLKIVIIFLVLTLFIGSQREIDNNSDSLGDFYIRLKKSIEVISNSEMVFVPEREVLKGKIEIVSEVQIDDKKEKHTINDDISSEISGTIGEEVKSNDDPIPIKSSHSYVNLFTERVNEDNLTTSLYEISEGIGSRRVGTYGNQRVVGYVYNKLKSFGFSFERGELQIQGLRSFRLYSENVIAKIPTESSEPNYIVFSAHLDSVRDTYGAVDNASGISTLLEISRILKDSGIDFGFEIHFCFFNAEEDGYYGAKKYLSRMTEEQIGRILCIYNLDMTAYDNSGRKKVLVVSTEGDPDIDDKDNSKTNIVSNAISKAFYKYNFVSSYEYFSPSNSGKHDIIPFVKAGIPGATISWREIDFERAIGNDFGISSPEWTHTFDDCYENTDRDSLYETTKLVAAGAGELIAFVQQRH